MAPPEESDAGVGQPITAAACLVNSSTGLSLPDELSRRLNIGDPVLYEHTVNVGPLQLRLFCEERHDAGEDSPDSRASDRALVSKWRQKEKLKTTAVALVMCLNIGVDPPDVIKISPCARLECWVDPLSMQPAKALETIGKNLQAQYERWQSRAKYKMHLDPTLDDVKKLCASCRRTAKNERVLFHYNGHGVPRPTVNGEIWVFNARYTQYIPLSMYELQAWLGIPCIYVLDCSAAGFIVNSFKAMVDNRQAQLLLQQQAAAAAAAAGDPGAAAAAAAGLGSLPAGPGDPMKEVIVLAACQGNELLPQNPDLPADVFTACLTTPIRVALRWFCSRSLLKQEGWTKELLERIPGRQTDRKTPLGELNWIFTAITDTIAWNCLPRAMFQKLFRQDLLVASLFRNFLLAERIMTAANCTPVSYPRLPPTHQHPLWQAWDMAVEMCLLQLPGLLADPPAEFQPSSFFSEQLTAFELWLAHGSADKRPPEQLPIVLQVLLSQVHRLRALVLLGRFLDMGPWAVDLALSVGIFPYVLKLLQTTSIELRTTLVFIWAKILALDRSCQADLVKDNGHLYFLKYLDAPEPGLTEGQRAQAAFVLAMVCDHHPRGQSLCAAAQLPQTLLRGLRAQLPELHGSGGAAFLSKWLCLCLGKVADGMPEVCAAAAREGAQDLLAGLLGAPLPELRAAAVYALGCLINPAPRRADLAAAAVAAAAAGAPPPSAAIAAEAVAIAAEQSIMLLMLRASVGYDASPLVRAEVAVALARLVRGHGSLLTDAVAWMQDHIAAQQRRAAELMRSSRSTSRNVQQAGASSAGAAGGGSSSSGGARGMPAGSGSTAPAASAAGASGGDPSGSSPAAAGGGGAGGTPGGGGSSDHLSRWGDAAAGLDPTDAYSADTFGMNSSMGLYCAVIELVLMLATDPAPRVAAYGKKVLSLAGLDLAQPAAAGSLRVPVAGSSSGAFHSQGGSMGSSSGSHPVPGGGAGGSPLGGGPGVTLGSAGASGGGSHLSASLGSLTSKLVKGAGRNWRSGFSGSVSGSTAQQQQVTTSSSRAAPGGSVSSTPNSSSPPSPHRDWPPVVYGRNPYILRSTNSIAGAGSSGSNLQQQTSGSFAGVDPHASGGLTGGPVGMQSASSSSLSTFAGEELQPGVAGGVGGGAALPQSQIFQLSCEYFSRPMLEPMASAWRELEAPKLAPWVSPPDVARRAQRLREMEAARQRCHGVTAPRMREQVRTFDLAGDAALSSVVFHSFHLLLVTVDVAGMVRVNNGVEGTTLNAFHISNGLSGPDGGSWCGSSAPVMFTRQLNEAESNLLLACAADGGVRVWRNYLTRGAQRIATAWQAVPLRQPPSPSPSPACFALGDAPYALYAAGGSHPDVLHRWDLLSEKCTHQLPARSSSGESSCPVALEQLSVGSSDPYLVLGSCSDGVLRLYDIRCPTPVAAIAAGPSPITGLVLEPCRRPAVIATGSERGELCFMDLRVLSDADVSGGPNPGAPGSSGTAALDGRSSSSPTLSCSLVRSVEAFSKTSLTTLVAHPNAPLIATGSTMGIVKVWSDTGDAVGTQRQVTLHSQQQRGNPVTSMAWHPFNLYLASVGMDSSATVYIIDNLPSAVSGPGVGGDGTPRVGGSMGAAGLSPTMSPVQPAVN